MVVSRLHENLILPRIAFTICTNQIQLPKKRPRKPETSIKDAFKEKEHEAVSNSVVTIPSSIRRSRTTFSEIPFLIASVHLPLERPEKLCLFTFQLDFPETFCKWEMM